MRPAKPDGPRRARGLLVSGAPLQHSPYNQQMGASPLRKILPWIPALLAVVMIGVESTSMMSSNDTSRWLLPLWQRLFGPISAARWAVVHHFIRKAGHFTGYGVVSLCFFYGWRKTIVLPGRSLRALWMRCGWLAIACAALVASADELHQSFLPSRTGSPLDVALDTCGAVVTQLVLLGLMSLFIRKTRAPLAGSFAAAVE